MPHASVSVQTNLPLTAKQEPVGWAELHSAHA